MNQIQKIASHLAEDPESRGFAEKTDIEVSEILMNTGMDGEQPIDTRVVSVQPVSNKHYLVWIYGAGRRDKLAAAAQNHASDRVRALCQGAIDLIQRPDVDYERNDHYGQFVALSNPALVYTAEEISALGEAPSELTPVLSSGDVAALNDQADVKVTEAEKYGLGNCAWHRVELARRQ